LIDTIVRAKDLDETIAVSEKFSDTAPNIAAALIGTCGSDRPETETD